MKTRQGNRAGRAVVAEDKSAALSTEFGLHMLRAKFPELAEEILARLGVFSKGPRKGLPRGYIHWRKVIEGGWNYSKASVERPGCANWVVRENAMPDSADIGRAVFVAKERAIPQWFKRFEDALARRKEAHKALALAGGNMRAFGTDYGYFEDFRHNIVQARRILRRAKVERAQQRGTV